MNKRIASLLMAVVMLLSLASGAFAAEQALVKDTNTTLSAAQFKDLADATKPDGRHWAWDSIDHVVKAGLFNGTSPTTFAPQNGMTRAQFVVVITRLENTTRTSNKLNVERVRTQTKFSDVPEDMWCAGAVAWASDNSIVEGFSDGTFRPNQVISRAQIAALVFRYVSTFKKYTLKVVTPEPAQFTDFSLVSEVFHAAVNYCRTHGLLQGYSDHTLRPNIAVTRAQVAAILSRIIIILEESSRSRGGGGSYNPPPAPAAGNIFSAPQSNIFGDGGNYDNANYGVKFVAVYNGKEDEVDGETYAKAYLSDKGTNTDPRELKSGQGSYANNNNNGFALTISPTDGYAISNVTVYGDKNGSVFGNIEDGIDDITNNYTYTKDTDASTIEMNQSQFDTDPKHFTVVAEIVASVQSSVSWEIDEGGAIKLERYDADAKDYVDVTDNALDNAYIYDTLATDDQVRFKATVTVDTFDGYELVSCAVTEETDKEPNVSDLQTVGTRVSKDVVLTGYAEVAGTDNNARHEGVVEFNVKSGGYAHVKVGIKQYEGYLLQTHVEIGNKDSTKGDFAVSMRRPNDSLVASMLLMNNKLMELMENGKENPAVDNAKRMKVLANALIVEINNNLKIEVKGDVLDRVLQDAINKTMRDKQQEMVEQVSGMKKSTDAPDPDWVTRLEDEITATLKTAYNNAIDDVNKNLPATMQQAKWQDDWRATIDDSEVAKVFFVLSDDDYNAITKTVLADIKDQLETNKSFKIKADVTNPEDPTKDADGNITKVVYTVVGKVEDGSIKLKPIDLDVKITMQYETSPGKYDAETAEGIQYTVKDNYGEGKQVPNLVNPADESLLFETQGRVNMEELNKEVAKTRLKKTFDPGTISASDIKPEAVEVKNFLTAGTLNSRFTKAINKVKGEGEAEAKVRAIYDPDNPNSGYIRMSTFSTEVGGKTQEIVQEITLNNGADVLLKIANADGSEVTDPAKANAIIVYPRLSNWTGAKEPDAATTVVPNPTDQKDNAGCYFDDLAVMANDVRKELSYDFILASLRNHPDRFEIYKDGEKDPIDADLSNKVIATVASKENEEPKVADLFRAFGATDAQKLTIVAKHTFDDESQIGSAMNTVFGSGNAGGEFTITRFTKLADAKGTNT